MYITHTHPPCSGDGEQQLSELCGLYRRCLTALRRYRHTRGPDAPASARGRE